MKNFPIIDIHLYLQKILYHIFALCATTFSPATAAATQPTVLPLFPTPNSAITTSTNQQTNVACPHLPLLKQGFIPTHPPRLLSCHTPYPHNNVIPNQYAAKRRSLPVARPLPLLKQGFIPTHPPRLSSCHTPYPHNDDLYKPICRQTPLVACGAATAPARRALPTFLTPFCPFPDPKFRHNHFNKSADKCGLPAFAPAPQGFPPLQKKHAPPPPRRRSPPR